MVRAVVTGAAGFIGSHLSERLVAEGWEVLGLDCFTPYYSRVAKLENVAHLRHLDGFELAETDLTSDTALPDLLAGNDVIFHLAAQPGVRLSWEDGFALYSALNVGATQRVLEAIRSLYDRPRLVFASSSSVYGEIRQSPTREAAALKPHSPYGVTKVACELLIHAYVANFNLNAVSLRFFSVYGPRQRPDMALHRMIEAGLRGEPFPVLGDGSNVRDFTYISDVVEACYLAATRSVTPGAVFNVAGGSHASVTQLLQIVGGVLGETVPVDERPAEPGDVSLTSGSIERIVSEFGWRPVVALCDGVQRQVEWHRAHARGHTA